MTPYEAPEGISAEYFGATASLVSTRATLNMKMKFSTVALATMLFVGLSLTSSFAQVGISIGIAPPPIPIYEQPYAPAAGYIWTPGYWAYDSGYYWVPGVWILPPRDRIPLDPRILGLQRAAITSSTKATGARRVGFYGGINYGYGYGGHGYYGGRWAGNTFRYNTAVTRVNTSVIHNTYVNNQVVRNTGSRASFNGPGGTTAKATAKEQAAAKAERIQLLRASSHASRRRRTIRICMLLIIREA